MAFSATALYLAGATALAIQNPPIWDSYSPRLLLVCLLVSAIVGFLFVMWQFSMREFAADIVEACTVLAAQWLTIEPTNLQPGCYRSKPRFYWLWRFRATFTGPWALVEHLTDIDTKRKIFAGPRVSELLTYLLMVIWVVMVIVRFFCARAVTLPGWEPG